MKKRQSVVNSLIAIIVISMFLAGTVIPIVNAANHELIGFGKGVTWKPLVPTKEVTFVNFDKESYLDDYAYLAAVPTSVFNEGNNLVSHPLLYFQEKLDYEDDKYRILDAYDGIEYFMEDWMNYSKSELDQMTLINVPKQKINSEWDARDYVNIDSGSPFDIANELALQDWSYSDKAVVAVIEEEFEKSYDKFRGSISGTLPSNYNIDKKTFEIEKPSIGVGANYEWFGVEAPYKYIVVDMYWRNVAVDLDLQLYDTQGVMADASSKWNIFYGAGEDVSSYVYDYGDWSVGVTYMPTQSLSDSLGDKIDDILSEKESSYPTIGKMSSTNSNMKTMGLFGSDTQKVEVYLYPGTELEIDDSTPFGCKNAEFTLKWDNPNVVLGFIVLDSTGTETASMPSNEEIIGGIEPGETELTIKLDRLGETQDDEKYKICVFKLNDVNVPVNFDVEYSWQQNITRMEGDCLASATEGSVLGSVMNSPLLYVSTDAILKDTEDVLYKLGVEDIYLVNLGDYLSNDVKQKLNTIADVDEFVEYKEIYDKIKDITKRHDVIFSTVDPWTYYYSLNQVPEGEYSGALFIGPAAYIAAYHGAPVLLVDNHPELSQAVAWHTQFWQKTANISYRPVLPSVVSMVSTGRNVMDFLESYDYILPEKTTENNFDLETMITVADQFDIGITWDRTFTGRLLPGRFCSSPVDIAYWMARSTFYPGLIFENPALQDTVTLTNGSKSKVVPYIGKLKNPIGTDLWIYRDQEKVDYTYPILHTSNIHLYNFNKEGSKHWGGMYTTANGITPYETPSDNPIDLGAVPEKNSAYYPDLHMTEVSPFYATQAGYSSCFSTNFDVTMENLNQGVIMWMEECHGGNGNYGSLGFWDPESPYIHEENPWRAYERPMISIAELKELFAYMPDFLSEWNLPEFRLLFRVGSSLMFPLNLLTVDRGSTDDPDVTVMNPEFPIHILNDAFRMDLRIKESKGLSLIPIIGRNYRSYGGDGVVIDPTLAGDIHLTSKTGMDMDEKLENLHSCGFNAVSCLIANTYLHTVMIRHGTPYQILDPWSTSWYSGLWLQDISRQLALGYTIGQTYERGMETVGVEYLTNQWWWDLNENVLFYGDPDLRVWTPKTKWDLESNNNWDCKDIQLLKNIEDYSFEGHMPYGATEYPNAKQPISFLEQYFLVIILALIILLVIIAIVVKATKGKKKK